MKMRAMFLLLFLLILVTVAFAAKPDKVVVCHVDPDAVLEGTEPNPHYISISERAVPAHLAHGDFLAPDGAEPGDPCVPLS